MFEKLFDRGGLSLDRLRAFLEMAEAGSISRAAPGDANRQSLISRQIKELEEFFGVELTLRRGKSLALSPAGERLAVLIREQLQDLEDFQREQAGAARTFTLGAGASTLEWMVTPKLPEIARALGRVTLRTLLRRSRALVQDVREGRVDFAVVRRDAIPESERRCTLPLRKLGFHVCIPRVLVRRGIAAGELADPALWSRLPFAAGRDGGQLDTAVREGMEELGVDFRPAFECGSMLQVRQLVKQGSCAAVLPDVALDGLELRTLHVLPFPPLTRYGRELVLHWNARQMNRRAVARETIQAVAGILKGG